MARPGNNTPSGRGRGGNIRINATDFVNIDGYSRNQLQIVDSSNPSTTFLTAGFSSGLFTNSERGASGDAGNIFVTTNHFRVADGGSVTASTANPNSDSGNITINARNFEASGGGQVVTTTRSRGDAGQITLNATENTTLTGSDPNFQQRREQVRSVVREPGQTTRVSDVITNQGANSGIFANTTRSGRGGTIDLNTQNLSLNDGATISTTSQRQGRAGNITITAVEQLQSADGNITTSANRSNGGNIQISGGSINLSQGSNIRTDVNQGRRDGGDINVNANAVRLQDDSDIQTRVGATGKGDGGDINVTANSVIAFDDSDIITEAPQGQGGDITLNTPAFFGSGYQPDSSTGNADGNGRVDLDASGSVSAGTVQTPDTSFIQNSLSDLPNNAIDTENLLANSCIARTENGGVFLITGTGGLPPNRPSSAPLSPYPTDTVRTETTPDWQPGDPIVEPQGIYRLPNGELVMMHECSSN